MSDDNIRRYVLTVKAGVRYRCPSCGVSMAVWVGETEGGDTLTCCGTCQRVIKRTPTASIPKLSVNSAEPGRDPAHT